MDEMIRKVGDLTNEISEKRNGVRFCQSKSSRGKGKVKNKTLPPANTRHIPRSTDEPG